MVVGQAASGQLGGSSISEQYARKANEVAVAGASALDDVEADAADAVLLELLKFERAYQGAARYVTTVDRLLMELLSLVR